MPKRIYRELDVVKKALIDKGIISEDDLNKAHRELYTDEWNNAWRNEKW